MGNAQSLLDLVVNRWPLLVTALFACFVAAVAPRVVNVLRLWTIPTIGEELGNTEKRRQAYLRGARKLYSAGYQKFKDGVFLITTSRTSPTIVISPDFLPELKKLPDATLSMEAAVDESMETKYTKIETSVPPHTIKGELTPSLSALTLSSSTEFDHRKRSQRFHESHMPPCDDWTEVNIHHALLGIVGMVSGRMFIGPELCRSEQYLDTAIKYTMEVMGAQRAVLNMRPWLRPFRAQSLPEVKKLYQRIAEAETFLEPVVKTRTDAMNDPSYEKPADFLQWLIDGKDKFPDKNIQNLAKVQLGLTFAAVHTTTLTATNAFYDLAALPDLQIELREKVREALSQSGDQFTSNVLQSMKKMDSFLKETLRVHPATMASFQRKVLVPFNLSNGQVIPTGVTIEIPAVAVSTDSNVFPHAEKFDPLRFYRLRTEAKNGGSVGKGSKQPVRQCQPEQLDFWYDVKNVGDATERSPNMEFVHMSIPDPSKKLLFKSIEV
ncbi:cycloheximide-inducible CIP70 (cytochrome P450 family) [Fusarium agapanthi]|uniref:Cycloheximide-inducible CIP70 (Cytochrome P450 family) n=1 Tax=Fusarium agapanthi TaxID=1803897 RepID=A0A9P5BC37_9HYPO|nr:cycloheximide-inducible CIP70 (cytochrome P450 family) [Fusarium agapanthi]